MKKLVHVSIAVFIIILTASSCKKDSTKPQTTTVTSVLGNSYWLGTFNSSINEGELFKSDGTTVEYDFSGTTSTDTTSCPYKAYGTYTINGNTVTFIVTFPTVGNETFTNVGVLNTSVSPSVISGTFSSTNGGNSGSFSFTKQ